MRKRSSGHSYGETKCFWRYTTLCILLCLMTIFMASLSLDDIISEKYLSNKTKRNARLQNGNIDIKLNDIAVNKETHNARTRTSQFEAMSSAEKVYVLIDGILIYEDIQAQPAGRGIHVIVINPYTLNVMGSRVFDTMIGNNQQHLAEYVNDIRDGLIVVLLVKDEASYSLRELGKQAIKSLGSKVIDKIGWRYTWALITRKGHEVLAEWQNKPAIKGAHGDPTIIKHHIDSNVQRNECNWATSTFGKKRAQFCLRYIGYQSLCDCNDPSPIDLQSPILLKNRVRLVPITIIASNRPHYLYQMLKKLLTTPGVNREMVTVYIDGFHDEPVALADLLQVKFVEHAPICLKNQICRLNQHYKFSLHDTFERHPHADYMIILEEDLEVALDIMDYFSQVLPVLASDESIYCISAWNDNSYNHSANDSSMLYRIEGMPGLGWVLKRDLFKNELELVWPSLDYYGDWDLFLRLPQNRKGRECIIPDVSRTFHFGKIGVHMNTYESNYYSGSFINKIINKKIGVKFDISKLTKDEYEKEMGRLIKEAEVLDHSLNPCLDKNFIPDTTGHSYVLYIKWAHEGDSETWLNVAKCFNLWYIDVRGLHKISCRFWLHQNQIFVIGSSSPYNRYKPANITPIEVSNEMMSKGWNFDQKTMRTFAV